MQRKSNSEQASKEDGSSGGSSAAIVFVLGGPGSGKGTQCANLVHEYKFEHYSTGDLLRNEVEQGTQLGQECKQLMDNGELVPAQKIVDLVKKAIQNAHSNRILLDGFPRAQEQVELFEKQFTTPTAVVYFECSHDTMKSRLLDRASKEGRSDDNEETVQNRLDTFEQQSRAVINHYQDSSVFTTVNSEKDAQQVYQDTLNSLAHTPLAAHVSQQEKAQQDASEKQEGGKEQGNQNQQESSADDQQSKDDGGQEQSAESGEQKEQSDGGQQAEQQQSSETTNDGQTNEEHQEESNEPASSSEQRESSQKQEGSENGGEQQESSRQESQQEEQQESANANGGEKQQETEGAAEE